ncbi:hypothetical protein ONE63_002863 [Megalurothrips usitatus]|uniref:Uncharacterized protein n=1 Tax=Megalurothrips usitatus TaxID=439358 RepID=A0AAV7X9R6_9NEOP|nr:hypothetical protein ONE63_002863 [Megalurothrips usitatus]
MDVEFSDKYEDGGVGGGRRSPRSVVHCLSKKARLEDAVPAGALPAVAAAAATTYLPYPDPHSYLYWYDSWALSAFRPWPSIFTATKDGKTQPMGPMGPLPFLRDSLPAVPPYLGQGPPVLLHPERMVPVGEYDKFERSYQPNVSLLSVPPSEPLEEKYSHVDVTSTEDEEASTTNNLAKSPSHTVSTIMLNPSRRSPAPSPTRSRSRSASPAPASPPPSPATSSAPPVSSSVLKGAQSPLPKFKKEIEMSSDTEDSASEGAGKYLRVHFVFVLHRQGTCCIFI